MNIHVTVTDRKCNLILQRAIVSQIPLGSGLEFKTQSFVKYAPLASPFIYTIHRYH